MTLTKSYNNGFKQWWSIYTWSLNKQSGVGAIYFILLCLALPFLLTIILFSSIKHGYFIESGHILSAFKSLFTLLIVPGTLLFVFITVIMLFKFIHNKRSTDFYHSLPVSRNAMFLGRFAAGFTMLAVPMVLCCCLTAMVLACMQGSIHTSIPYDSLFIYMAYLLLVIIVTFTFTTFIAICSGTIFNMIVSIVAISVSYPILTFLLYSTANYLLPGFSFVQGHYIILTAGSPYMAAFMPMIYMHREAEGTALSGDMIGYISWWVAITVVLFIATWLLYRFRKSENAGSHKAYPVPQIIIRTMVSGVVGIGFGYLLLAVMGSTVLFFVGLVIGAVIAHVIIEVLYARGFKTLLKSTPYLAVFFVLYGIYYAILATGCFGYDTKVPLSNQVESVDVKLSNTDYYEILDMNGKELATTMPVQIKDRVAIEAVINWHQTSVDHNRQQYPYGFSIYAYDGNVRYHLKDGSTLTREIELFAGPAFSGGYYEKGRTELQAQKSSLKMQEEYIKKANIIFYIEPQAMDTVKVIKSDDQNSYVETSGQKETLLEMIQQDVLRKRTREASAPVDNEALDEKAAEDDPNAVHLEIDLIPFVPSQNGYIRQLIGDYQDKIQLSRTKFIFSISQSEYPNTYQYLLDHHFI